MLMDTATAALIASALATTGWLYAARRARALSRKQHTITVMIQASFNSDFQGHIRKIGPYLVAKTLPVDLECDLDLKFAVRKVLNHYEFIAAGLRNGDFDERLVMDSERAAILQLYLGCKKHIWSLRNDRNRMSLYEHLEWLHARWSDPSSRKLQTLCERIIQRPFQGTRHNHKKSVAG